MTTQQEMTAELVKAGYREITINSYNDFISGCRYVSIKPTLTVPISACQYVPTGDKPSWIMWDWKNIESWDGMGSARYRLQISRSTLGGTYLDQFDWFGKPSEVIGAVRVVRSTKEWVPCDFGEFITTTDGGFDNPFKIQFAFEFDKKHPSNPVDRLNRDVDRRMAELKAREESLKQQETWAQFNQIMSLSGQYATLGMSQEASRYRRLAEEVRKNVQNALDKKLPVTRMDINLEEPPEPEIVKVRMLPVSKSKRLAAPDPTNTKRSIILDGEDF